MAEPERQLGLMQRWGLHSVHIEPAHASRCLGRLVGGAAVPQASLRGQTCGAQPLHLKSAARRGARMCFWDARGEICSLHELAGETCLLLGNGVCAHLQKCASLLALFTAAHGLQ